MRDRSRLLKTKWNLFLREFSQRLYSVRAAVIMLGCECARLCSCVHARVFVSVCASVCMHGFVHAHVCLCGFIRQSVPLYTDLKNVSGSFAPKNICSFDFLKVQV